MRLAKGSLPWILIPLLAAGVLLLTPQVPWGWAAGSALLASLIALFFRDPDREPGPGIVAAADGRIQAIEAGNIVTFLNIHDVHVVRAPFAGRVTRVERFTGPHLPAFLEGAKRNAGVAVTLETEWGTQDVRLVAGLIARRAVPFVEEGEALEKGQRIGVIRFGSRVDVELPEGSKPVVEPGGRVRAGETRIASPPLEAIHDERGAR